MYIFSPTCVGNLAASTDSMQMFIGKGMIKGWGNVCTLFLSFHVCEIHSCIVLEVYNTQENLKVLILMCIDIFSLMPLDNDIFYHSNYRPECNTSGIHTKMSL